MIKKQAIGYTWRPACNDLQRPAASHDNEDIRPEGESDYRPRKVDPVLRLMVQRRLAD
jgi:hypothetical protein